MTALPDYDRYDALGLAELVRTRQVAPLELVEAAIERIEATNPQVNAVVLPMFAQAQTVAKGRLPAGPFCGVPFLLKDLLSAHAGVAMTSGSRFLRSFVPERDSELVRRYKAAGVIIIGKTNTPELGIVPYTEPELFGPTRNPWDLSRSPGGSSGGSAAAVAARMTPMAGGGDGGGSIRIPASCCGLFGLKPTRGRTPTGPDQVELWEGLAVEHVLTRSVRDSGAMLDAIAGPDIGAPYAPAPPIRPFLDEVGTPPPPLRIAFTSRPLMGHGVAGDCVEGLHATVKLLEDLGHTVEEAAPEVDREELNVHFAVMLAGQIAGDVQEMGELVRRTPRRSEFEALTWALILLGRAIRSDDYVTSVRALKRIGRNLGAFFERYDLLLTPTLAAPPAPIGSLQPPAGELRQLKMAGWLGSGRLLLAANMVHSLADKAFDHIPYTIPFNITGQPAMSVPLHWNAAGLPIGMHFVGRYGDEATLLRLAGQLEAAKPWADRRPPLIA